jgi:hypothetical protein
MVLPLGDRAGVRWILAQLQSLVRHDPKPGHVPSALQSLLCSQTLSRERDRERDVHHISRDLNGDLLLGDMDEIEVTIEHLEPRPQRVERAIARWVAEDWP